MEFNRRAVLLTKEDHLYDAEDEAKLRAILDGVRDEFNGLSEGEGIAWKASYLVYWISAGQHFHEGNKRTALITGAALLKMNGFTIDIEDKQLLQILDKCSILIATLKELHYEIQRLIKYDR